MSKFISLFFLSVSCTGPKTATDLEEAAPLRQSVLEIGPSNVGHKLTHSTYSDPLGQRVTIAIDIWYPTEDNDGTAAKYFDSISDDAVISEASLADSTHVGGHPVIVFSHGSNLYGGSSAFLMRHFASHGWVAVAPTHVGNTIIDFGSGDCATDAYGCRSENVWLQRPLNTVTALESIPEAVGSSARVDSVILAGYSYGAYDTWARAGGRIDRFSLEEACSAGGISGGCSEAGLNAISADLYDDRIAAIIPMAGAHAFPFTAKGLENLVPPALQMSGTLDDDSPDWVWDNSEGTALTWLSIEGACHGLWSFGGCTEIDIDEGQSIIAAYALAFSRKHLFEDESEETLGLLDGSIAPWPLTDIRSK